MQFHVHRVPFFLEPDYDEALESVENNTQRMHRKWGGKEAYLRQRQRHDLGGRGEEVGIGSFDGKRLASSTMRSHRLVRWAAATYGEEISETMYAALGRRHFEEGHALNALDTMLGAAAEAGIEREAAQDFLLSDAAPSRQDILNLNARVTAAGISSIPTFVVDGQYVVNGAARAAEFVQLFRSLEGDQDSLRGEPAFVTASGAARTT